MRRTLAALALAASLLFVPLTSDSTYADEGGSYARPVAPITTVQDEGGSYAQPNAPAEGVWDYEFVVPQTVPTVREEDSGADHPVCWSNTLHKYVPCP